MRWWLRGQPVVSFSKSSKRFEFSFQHFHLRLSESLRAQRKQENSIEVKLERDGMDRVKVVVTISRIKFNNLFSNDQEN